MPNEKEPKPIFCRKCGQRLQWKSEPTGWDPQKGVLKYREVGTCPERYRRFFVRPSHDYVRTYENGGWFYVEWD